MFRPDCSVRAVKAQLFHYVFVQGKVADILAQTDDSEVQGGMALEVLRVDISTESNQELNVLVLFVDDGKVEGRRVEVVSNVRRHLVVLHEHQN